MPALTAPQLQYSAGPPDRVMMMMRDLDEQSARYMAIEAVSNARQSMPRVTGRTASRLVPISGEGWFGIYFPDSHTWFMEHGTRPFTMRSLAGKVIPMWIEDPTGEERRKNPKARVRTTQDGRVQVQIFRRAARIGQRKTVKRRNKVTGVLETTTTPASYPGAPGRISRRAAPSPFTPVGQRGGQISSGNVGVRWRHPGLNAMQFLNSALAQTAFEAGFLINTVYALDGGSFEGLLDKGRI